MTEPILYKYLDAKGALMMLRNCNLQFTHPVNLNDPFECNPSLINFSNVPAAKCKGWPPEIVRLLESQHYKRQWEKTWLCSLSKTFDNLLMWAHYCQNHQGVCIGLDMKKADKYLSRILNGVNIGIGKLEVQYEEIAQKPDYFHDFFKDFFRYQLATKAKDWAYEKEVRLLMNDPHPSLIPIAIPSSCHLENEDECVDIKKCRFYPQIGKECFCALYLGINIGDDERDELIKIARLRNPDINIYQMKPDLDAFKLVAELVDNNS